ncbi:MAG: hypothetical protein IH596_04970 [Bacteroidales bacterium]|nr:hypothetical protein [Bacteroidales bacterium]
MNNPADYRANGKLLLAGEYLVLAGACALALPLRYGQSMNVKTVPGKTIAWKSIDSSGQWFEAHYHLDTLEIISSSDVETARVLNRLLTAARDLQPDFLLSGSGVSVVVTADYPLQWGWGSSATLISLVAQWSGADPFILHHHVSDGSGFDIACAESRRLIFYQLLQGQPVTQPAIAGEALKKNTWFCYLGNPQKSSEEVSAFRETEVAEQDIREVSDLSVQICRASSGDELIRMVRLHEIILGKILKRDPIGIRYPSFPGAVKSLGAWGGDFAMFVSSSDPGDVSLELTRMGFSTIYRYHEIAIAS